MKAFKIVHGNIYALFDVHTIEQINFPADVIYFGFWSCVDPCLIDETICIWRVKWKNKNKNGLKTVMALPDS